MSQKITNDAGEEIEVYTADEVAAARAETETKVKGEYEPKLTEATEKLTDAEKRAAERAGEFAQFRKLSDEAVLKLSVAERTIYENGLALEQERTKRVEAETSARKAQVDSIIKTKAGGNQPLIDKMNEMWPLMNIEALTPEQIEAKATMVLGALSTTVPDLVAQANGFAGGSYQPPQAAKKEGESYADTEAGKKGAAELGLMVEAPKQA